MASAISSARVRRRPSGTRSSTRRRAATGSGCAPNQRSYWSDSHSAGTTQFTRTPSFANATAHSRVSALIAPFDAA